MVVFGGMSGATPKNDVWELALGTTREWKLLKPTGTPPPARRGHVAIYDPVGDRMIVQGGSGLSYLNDAWALSLSGGTPAWTQLAPSGTLRSAGRVPRKPHNVRSKRIFQHGLDKASSGLRTQDSDVLMLLQLLFVWS